MGEADRIEKANTAKETLIADVTALLNYASERHLLTGDTPDATQALRANLLEPLSKALAAYENAKPEAPAEIRHTLLFYYSALAKLTAPVTGQSVRCSLSRKAYSSLTVWVTFGILLVAVLLEAKAILLPGLFFSKDVLDFVRPLAWGSLGSCIFLLKSISDKVADFEFDDRLLKGFATRVVIGGVLGMVIVKLFQIDYGTKSLTPSAIAFLVGLGMKVIYGALENIIEALAERLTYSAFKKEAPKDTSATVEALPTPSSSVTTQPAASTSAGSQPVAAVEDGEPFSILVAIKRQLAARGINPGPIDPSMNTPTIEAIQAFVKRSAGAEASVAQVRAASPLLLLRWLRAGRVPEDWQEQIRKGEQAPADPQDAANRQLLDLLKQQGIGNGAPPGLEGGALDRVADQAISDLVARKPQFGGQSFTQILDSLKAGAKV